MIGRLGFEWRVATRFLREGRMQTLLIVVGVAAGVAVVAYISALIDGLQRNTLDKTLGAQPHVTISALDDAVLVPPPPAQGTTGLLQTQPRAQRPRSILNWQTLMADLRMLAKLRHGTGDLPSGQRNLFVFLGACFLASALVTPRFRAEVRALAQEFAPAWSAQELTACISAVQRRLEAASKGETVEFQGHPVDPRYRFRNSTLVDWLGITTSEMPHMKAILSADEARERDRVRKQAERRAKGSVTREVYLQASANKAEVARALRDTGNSLAEIAHALGISRTSASRYCKRVT